MASSRLGPLSILPALVLAPLVLGTARYALAEVVEVDEDALAALLARDVPVIDVRREDEWRSRGVIEGSHPLTFFDASGRYDVEAWLEALSRIASPDEPIVLLCAHGVRSARIADLLDARLGFAAVHNVTDGIEGWREAGGEIVPYADPRSER